MTSQSVKKECLSRVSSKSVSLASKVCPARVSRKSVLSRVYSQSVKKECLVKSVTQECLVKSFQQDCPDKSAKKECPVKSVQQECLTSVEQECQARVSCQEFQMKKRRIPLEAFFQMSPLRLHLHGVCICDEEKIGEMKKRRIPP